MHGNYQRSMGRRILWQVYHFFLVSLVFWLLFAGGLGTTSSWFGTSWIMYADVPTKGVRTLYPHIGDIFGWVCVVGALGLILLTIVLSIRRKRQVAATFGAKLPST